MYMSLLWFCQLCFVIFCKTEREDAFVPTPLIFILENNWAAFGAGININVAARQHESPRIPVSDLMDNQFVGPSTFLNEYYWLWIHQ